MRSLLIFPLLFCITSQKTVINIGMLFSKDVSNIMRSVGYRTSASAVLLAEERIRDENLLNNYTFNYTIRFSECLESLAAGETIDLIKNSGVDVIIGPTCNRAGIAVASIASFYNIPVFQWGLTTSAQLMNLTKYPTSTTLAVDTTGIVVAVRRVMNEFEWDEFVLLYSYDGDYEKCHSIKNDFEDMTASWDELTLAFMYRIETISIDSIKKALEAVSSKGRIIVVCLASGYGYQNALIATAYKNGYSNEEYVYIFAEPSSRGFYIDNDDGSVVYSWQQATVFDSGMSESELQEASRRVIYVCDNMGLPMEYSEEFQNFTKQVIERMKDPPFNCVEDCKNSTYKTAATYTSQLHDAFIAYSKALNISLISNPNMSISDGIGVMESLEMSFTGIDGNNITLYSTGAKTNYIYMIALNSSKLPYIAARMYVDGDDVQYTKFYNTTSCFWDSGIRPLSRPICGFSGTECPLSFTRDFLVYVIIGGGLIILAIFAGFCGICNTIRLKKKEMKLQDMMWQICYIELKILKLKSRANQSHYSFASNPSAGQISDHSESSDYIFFNLNKDIVSALSYNYRPILSNYHRTELRQMLNIDHENVNRFIGLCLDGPQILSIWRYCSRGSVADVIQKSSVQMDNFFIISLIKDIANGLSFIHNSFLKYHGYLTSKCCLIDDRWQIKISDYGLECLKELVTVTKKNLLWTAPEYLRDSAEKRTKEGDIYSFGIICSEIVMKTSPFDYENRNEKAEELIYQIKKGGHNPMRPSLESSENNSINPSLIHLIRDCWTEKPSDRPTIHDVKTNLTSMTSGRKENLMDYVFNMLETYAATLEEEVSERTKELVEEKKKSDVLLYRMLPRTVADKLKLGQVIEPETYEKATIFFSDVVKFTALAAKCSPLQVVTLVNDLYTIFDGIIEQHDVYKVETIGDGYLCVSGVPHRNGDEHCRQIARMALDFLSSLDHFLIRHLPMERINLRIGINTGPVVAGVVGLAMPRYCLFGDSVNTASRMESNGKPGRIHLTSEANRMLTEVIGGFETESRGEVIIKGKGVMETFWLIGEKNRKNITIKAIKNEEILPKEGLYAQFKNQNFI